MSVRGKLLCVDPGSRYVGAAILGPRAGDVPLLYDSWTATPAELMQWLRAGPEESITAAAIELVGHYGRGMPAGKDVFDTCELIGRIRECLERQGRSTETVQRQTVKTSLCGKATARDANVRQALIDLWGGDIEAIGGRRCQTCKGKGWVGRGRPTCTSCGGKRWDIPPGPLHGVKGHAWSALAVGVTYLKVQV